MVSGESTVTSAFATSPLKILTPRSRGKSVWAYTSSFGGGLVAGDQTQLDLQIGKDARCFVGTQASTKIYRNPALLLSGHITRATLSENSLLVFAPDPVQAFANSTYTQRQEFHLGAGAGLVLVDWFTSGRAARGERWAFNKFQSRNEVWSAPVAAGILPAVEPGFQPGGNGVTISSAHKNSHTNPGGRMPPYTSGRMPDATQLIFLDSLLLDQNDSVLDGAHRMGRFNCMAMLLLIGEPLEPAAKQLLESISTQPVIRRAPLVRSASPVHNGAMLRIAGESVEEVGRELHRHLTFLSKLLGDDPWERKW